MTSEKAERAARKSVGGNNGMCMAASLSGQ